VYSTFYRFLLRITNRCTRYLLTLNKYFLHWSVIHIRNSSERFRKKIFFSIALYSLVDQSLFVAEASRSQWFDTPHSAGFLWTSDQPDAETSTWQNTTLTTDRHTCPQLDSNPQSRQEAIDRRPKPWTVRPMGSALNTNTESNYGWWFMRTDASPAFPFSNYVEKSIKHPMLGKAWRRIIYCVLVAGNKNTKQKVQQTSH